ncbi:MAG: TetR/AcrR family transcriptional regulator [Caulobacterales bacterium]
MSRPVALDRSFSDDRRVERTREALMHAFRDLFFERGFEALSIGEIADRARIGRSTFYKHFAGKDDLLSDLMGHDLGVLADASMNSQQPFELTVVIERFWDQRRHARAVLGPESRLAMTRLLAGLIETRLAAAREAHPEQHGGCPVGLAAILVAAGQIAFLEAWLTGRRPCSRRLAAESLHGAGFAAVAALSGVKPA